MKTNTYTVGPESCAERLDMFVSARSAMTRSHILRMIKQGLIKVNSRKEKAGYKVKEHDLIEILIPEASEGRLVPEDIPLEIVWEDDYLVIVNKPPHMVMYPAAGNTSGTLVNALLSKCDKLSPVGAPLRPGIVHRLDKDTSGLLIIAKDKLAHYTLVDQFRHREIDKTYLALLFGDIKSDSGEIRTMIGRSSSDRKKMSVRSRRGKEAVTHYEVVERFGTATLARVNILTGRTHQIRVHFASAGNPVLGDKTYGKKTVLLIGGKPVNFPRQMLHAYSLKLKHPITGEDLEFTAPMPDDMKGVIKELSD